MFPLRVAIAGINSSKLLSSDRKIVRFSEKYLAKPNNIVIFAFNRVSKKMVQIKTEEQYNAACDRINELLKVVGNNTPADDKNMLELDFISDLVADYEEAHYPIAAPTL